MPLESVRAWLWTGHPNASPITGSLTSKFVRNYTCDSCVHVYKGQKLRCNESDNNVIDADEPHVHSVYM